MAEDVTGQGGDAWPVQALYDDAPCALFSTRPDGEVVRANRTFAEWLGVSLEDIIGRVRFPALLTMGSRMYYETHYAPLLRMQGFVSEIALEVRTPAGRVSPVVASARQIRDAAGSPVLVHVALFDATDRRSYERELLQERKRAEQASRALEAADQRKNEFIAMLAHELRNPLAPLRAAIELQRRESGAAGQPLNTAELMRRQVDQMVRLVEDLLDVSRIGQDKLSIQKERRRPRVDRRSGDRGQCIGAAHGAGAHRVPATGVARPGRSGRCPPGSSARQPAEQRRQIHPCRRPRDANAEARRK